MCVSACVSPVTSVLRCVTCYDLQVQVSKKKTLPLHTTKWSNYTLLPVLVIDNYRDIKVWVYSSMLLIDLCVNMLIHPDFVLGFLMRLNFNTYCNDLKYFKVSLKIYS